VLLSLLDIALGAGQTVHGLRVFGICLEGAAQVAESPQTALLLVEDRTQVFGGRGAGPWSCRRLIMEMFKEDSYKPTVFLI